MKFVTVALLVALASAATCANKGWSHCSTSKKCGPGIGDCDGNSHCKSGLKCVSSIQGQHIRGSAVDCCQCGALVTSVGGWSACTNDCPCGEGGGDCDSNAQCKGALLCESTKPGQHISGSAKDKCVKCLTVTSVGAWNACTDKCPCNEGGGDCDSDKQCKGTLVCESTKPGQPIGGSAKDKCVKPCPTVTTVGAWNACTDKCPCNEGGGDCDSDKQCKGTLVCRSVKAGQPISGSAKDKCEKPCSGRTTRGGWSACTKSKPCCRGGGDCDNDQECAGALKCISTKAGQSVAGWAFDICDMPVAVEGDADEAEPVDEVEQAIEGTEGEAEDEAAEATEAEPVEAEVETEAEPELAAEVTQDDPVEAGAEAVEGELDDEE